MNMTIQQWESYKLRTLAKTTGANVHDVTGLLYSLRDVIQLRDNHPDIPKDRMKRITDNIDATIRSINKKIRP